MNLSKDLDKLYYFLFFLIFLIIFRLIPHPPNFSPIISFAVLSPLLLQNKNLGALLIVLAMFISDIILGFHTYQIVIYLTLIFISYISTIKKSYIRLFATSLFSSLIFFIVTNFAVWFFWDYYPKTFEGLVSCYTLAIPFFQNTLLSTVIFTIGILGLHNYIEKFKNILSNILINKSKY